MIRVAGQEAPPEEMPTEEVPAEPMPPEAPAKTLYGAEKQTIMEAMAMLQQALDMLMEVCPPEGYVEDEPEALPEALPGESDSAEAELGIPE